MAVYVGDFDPGSIIYLPFTTLLATGGAATFGSTPGIAIRKDGQVTFTSGGVLLSTDVGGIVGQNLVTIASAFSSSYYAAGSNFYAIVTSGSVGGVGLSGYVVGMFSLQARSPLRPTTAGRTITVAASGQVGVNWGDVTNQGSSVTLSATTIAGVTNITPAMINAEVVDALATDTYAEPGQATPSATASLSTKLNYLFKAWLNRLEETATQYKLYNNAGTTVDQKATVADDGTTFTRGAIVSGP